MNWQDKDEVKLGNIGEEIINNYLASKNLVVYKPVTDNAHAFDRLISKGKEELILCEVKTKPKRNYLPDTGFNHSNYLEYKRICEKHNLKMFVFFVDFNTGEIYGDYLHIIDTLKSHEYQGKRYCYPKIEVDKKNKEIIYFFQPSMRKIGQITTEMVEEMRGLSKRNYEYAEPLMN